MMPGPPIGQRGCRASVRLIAARAARAHRQQRIGVGDELDGIGCELGHAPATYTETARVRPPEDGEAQVLHMDPDQRVVTIQRIARTAAGRIVEVNQIILPAHQWELVYEWPAE